MTFEQHTQAALARHEAGFDALPAVVAALDALAKERLASGRAKDQRGLYLPPGSTYGAYGPAIAGGAVNPAYRPEPRSVSHWGMFA